MDFAELEQIVQRKERTKIDFKREHRLDRGDGAYLARRRSDLAWDVAALANTRGGTGYLIIGIDEETLLPVPGGVVGISADQIQQILTTHCSPPVYVEIDIVPWETGEPVLVISVPRSDRKPHVVRRRGCPVRRGATTDFAGHHELVEMARESGGVDFGQTLVRTARADVLDLEQVERYLAGQGQPTPDGGRPSEGVLAGHGLVGQIEGQPYATAGAVLLFCRTPQRHFPHATLSLVRVADEGGADPLDSAVADGPVLSQVQTAERFFRRNLAGDYPIEVLREAVVNALIHRDYAIGWAEVSVRLSADRVEVASPGLLLGGLDVADLGRQAISHPPRRNPSLVNLFFAQTRGQPNRTALYVERAGSGLNRMRERLAQRGLPEPVFREDEQHGLFIVSLHGVPLAQPARTSRVAVAGLNLRQRQFLEQREPDAIITARQYQERFDVSRATATADLAGLVRLGLMHVTGSGPLRRYAWSAQP